MEPNDLKSLPDDAFETLLRANAALPPLADAGFSQRLLATLPAPSRRRSRRGWAAALGLAGGIAAMLAGGALGGGAAPGLPGFNAELVDAVNQLLTPAGTGALLLTAGSLWFAFRERWRPGWSKRF
jgi:ferric-dicitrate binding protein FerR (iron transport regulator)